jgi:hypothetical protein
MAAQGMTQQAIADTVGLHPSNVSRKINKAEIRAMVEAESQRLTLEAAALISNNSIKKMRQAGKILDDREQPAQWAEDLKGRKYKVNQLNDDDRLILQLADKTEHRIGQAIGMLPSQSASLYIQNLYNGPVTLAILPNVALALGQRQIESMGFTPEDDLVLDVGSEPIDVD